MAVPAHDERDYEFAKQFNLPIKTVIAGQDQVRSDLRLTGTGALIAENEKGNERGRLLR